MGNCFALGLFQLGGDRPTPKKYAQMHQNQLDVFEKLSAVPTYYHWRPKGSWSAKMKKFGFSVYRRQLSEGFSDIESVSLVANPKGSNAPAFDGFLGMNYSYMDYGGHTNERYPTETSLTFWIDTEQLEIDQAGLVQLFREFAILGEWDFGFGLSQKGAMDPLIHVLSGGNGRETIEEKRRGEVWYSTPHSERLVRLRDVYEWNVVTDMHLAAKVSWFRNLKQFIVSDSNSTLHELKSGLWLWEVNRDATELVRRRLINSGILISE